jgi:aminoglycoside 6'-N-acetyltransferase I
MSVDRRLGVRTMRVKWIRPGDEQRVLDAAHLFDRPPTLESTREYLAHDRNYLLLAYLDDGAVAGFVRGTELQRLDGPERQMLLYEIGTAPEYQRRGVGKALIQELERICRDAGLAEMFVFTNRSNTAAMRLYESTGGHTESDDEQMFVWTLIEGFED